MLAQETIEQVRAYPDIVGIISEYVTLKKKGRNYIGLCPFHSEKTPSFTVSPEKQIYHCFGCHASGDHINFLMQIDTLSFSEAVIHIAQKAGINIIEEKTDQKTTREEKQHQKFLDILLSAREFFKYKLTANRNIQEYLHKRGLEPAVIQQFHLGFSPSDHRLQRHLLDKGFHEDDLIKSGLILKNEQGLLISRFRNRLIFPIVDYRGRTIGFGGRIIDDSSK
ncbi:DNA primase, partial [Thermoproteota archaeon]